MPRSRKPRPREPAAAARIRHVIALDAANVMKRLRARREEMVALFSRLRSREPMLETLRSGWASITFAELASLEPAEQRAVNGFYELLGELRWYLQYTEDMPGTVQQRLLQHWKQLEEGYLTLGTALRLQDVREAQVVVESEVVASAPVSVRVLGSGRGPRHS